jgi:hypothetical protein
MRRPGRFAPTRSARLAAAAVRRCTSATGAGGCKPVVLGPRRAVATRPPIDLHLVRREAVVNSVRPRTDIWMRSPGLSCPLDQRTDLTPTAGRPIIVRACTRASGATARAVLSEFCTREAPRVLPERRKPPRERGFSVAGHLQVSPARAVTRMQGRAPGAVSWGSPEAAPSFPFRRKPWSEGLCPRRRRTVRRRHGSSRGA